MLQYGFYLASAVPSAVIATIVSICLSLCYAVESFNKNGPAIMRFSPNSSPKTQVFST